MDVRARDLRRRRAPEEREAERDLFFEELEHRAGAFLAADGEPEDRCAPDEHGTGAERDSAKRIYSTSDSAVEQHLGAPVDRVGDLGQGVDRRAPSVELAASVVRDDERGDAVLDG